MAASYLFLHGFSLFVFLLFKHRESFPSIEREEKKRRRKHWRAINSSLAIFWVDSFHKRCPDLSINPGREIDDYMYKGYEELGWTRYAKIISDKKDRENFHFARKIEGCAAHGEIRSSLSLSLSLLVSRYLARERISNIFCNIAQFRYVT